MRRVLIWSGNAVSKVTFMETLSLSLVLVSSLQRLKVALWDFLLKFSYVIVSHK